MAITRKQHIFGAAILLLSILSIAMCGFTLASAQANEPESRNEHTPSNETLMLSEEKANINPSLETDHEHIWRQVTEFVHHDAETHQVEHPAEYESITTNHTVCNICEEVIDGRTSEHAKETGHNAYTTQVPVYENTLVKAAWTETVVDKDAYDELEVVGETCAICNIGKDKEHYNEK